MATIKRTGHLYQLTDEILLPVSLQEAWDFLSKPANLQALTPPEMDFQLVHGDKTVAYPGAILIFRVKPLPMFYTRMVSEITHMEPQAYFIDKQLYGPYAFWHHEHRIIPADDGTIIQDKLYYRMPWGILGRLAHRIAVKKSLLDLFAFRRQKMVEWANG